MNDKRRAEIISAINSGFPSAPSWGGDYSNWYAIPVELRYLATFFYKKDMLKFLLGWKAWMDKNTSLLQLTPEEKIAFDGFIERVRQAQPPRLKPILYDIVCWMDDYQHK